jgi:hypothetical protein
MQYDNTQLKLTTASGIVSCVAMDDANNLATVI